MPSGEATICAGCGAPVGALAVFCGACGERVVRVGLELDLEPIRHLEVGARGLLRLRVSAPGAAIDDVGLALTIDGGALESAATGPLAAASEALVSLVWTPPAAGFHALGGTLTTGDRTFDLAPLHLRVGSAGAPVSITIDQSHAKVVDNSRSSFGPGPSGGVLGDGDWQPLELTPRRRPSAPALPERPVFAPVAFSVTTATATYDVHDTVAHGDIATVYAARVRNAGVTDVVVKIVDERQDNDLAQAEVDVLAELTRDPGEAPTPVAHLPVVRDRFKTGDGRLGTVFERCDGIDLIELRRRLAARGEPGLAPRHLIWLMRRVLAVLGWAHGRGIVHGNLDPAHLIVRPRDHMLWLVDWSWAIVNPARTGQGFKARNEIYSPPEVAERKPPIPASDLYALGKCVIFAAGGDPATKTLPARDDLDERLARFIKWLVSESPRGRPQDALQLYLQVERLRDQIWGAHAFVPLDV